MEVRLRDHLQIHQAVVEQREGIRHHCPRIIMSILVYLEESMGLRHLILLLTITQDIHPIEGKSIIVGHIYRLLIIDTGVITILITREAHTCILRRPLLIHHSTELVEATGDNRPLPATRRRV